MFLSLIQEKFLYALLQQKWLSCTLSKVSYITRGPQISQSGICQAVSCSMGSRVSSLAPSLGQVRLQEKLYLSKKLKMAKNLCLPSILSKCSWINYSPTSYSCFFLIKNICMHALCVCLVLFTCLKEGVWSLGTGILDCCEPPCGYWEFISGSLCEMSVLLNISPVPSCSFPNRGPQSPLKIYTRREVTGLPCKKTLGMPKGLLESLVHGCM